MQRNGNSFDALRLLAAFLVFHSHQYALSGASEASLPWFRTSWSGVGVAMFFAMSGYLVTQSVQRSATLPGFYWNRAVRIAPGLVVNVLFLLALGMAFTTRPLIEFLMADQTREFARNNIFLAIKDPRYILPGVFEANPQRGVNGSLWTLPYEIAMYVLLGLCFCTARGRLSRIVMAAGAALVCLWVLRLQVSRPSYNPTFELWNWFTLQPFGIFGMVFAMGSLFALLGSPRRIAILAAASAVALFFAAPPQASAYVLLAAAVVLVGESHALRLPPGLGDISYGFYLYAFPVQQALIDLVGTGRFAARYAVGLIVTLLLAYASWRLVEAPALRHKWRAPQPEPKLA